MNYNILADSDFYNHQFFSDYEKYSNKFVLYKIIKFFDQSYIKNGIPLASNIKVDFSTAKNVKIRIKSEQLKPIVIEYDNEDDLFKQLNDIKRVTPEYTIPVINFKPVNSSIGFKNFLYIVKLPKVNARFPINFDLFPTEFDIFYKLNLNHNKLIDYFSNFNYKIQKELDIINIDNHISIQFEKLNQKIVKFLKLNVINNENQYTLYRQNIKSEKSKLALDEYLSGIIKNEKS